MLNVERSVFYTPLPFPRLAYLTIMRPLRLSAKAQRTTDSPINALISAKLSNPDLINFAAGLVDEPTLPVEEVREITQRLFA